jgi:hypothetical protein
MATDKPQITIYDNETGLTVVRDMTAEELAELEANAPTNFTYPDNA